MTQIPLQITFRDMDASPAIEARVREMTARLDRFLDRIIGCRVTIEAKSRHQRKGKLYNIRIEISVPGQDIHVDHVGPQDHSHEDAYVAIRDAFNAATRQLEDHARRMRGDVKTHEAPAHGKVIQLRPDYGVIQAPDGEEIYFHKNSVAEGRFEALEVGNEVRFVVAEKEGEKGPQASSVVMVAKHHVVG